MVKEDITLKIFEEAGFRVISSKALWGLATLYYIGSLNYMQETSKAKKYRNSNFRLIINRNRLFFRRNDLPFRPPKTIYVYGKSQKYYSN